MTVEISTLKNGLRVATEVNRSVESIALGVWVDVGNRYEPKALNGISHFLEHMVFKGTKNRDAFQIVGDIEAVGGQINAFTSREHTTFYAKVLKEDYDLAIEVLSDILLNPALDEEELKREQEVILQEIGQVHDTPDELIFDRLQKKAYPKQAVGRSILGSEKSVSRFTKQDLKEYLSDHYTAENMVLVAVGNLDHQKIIKAAETHFSGLKRKGRSKFEEASYSGGATMAKRRLEQLHFALGFESFSYRDPDYFSAQVFSTILGGGMSSRLFQEIREKRGYAYSVYAFNGSLSDTGLFNIYVGTGPEYVTDMIPIVAKEMKALSGKIPSEEIERAKAQLRAGLLMALESTSNRAEQIGRQILIYGRPFSIKELKEKIDRVDQAAINDVTGKILKRPLTVAGIGPTNTIPEAEQVFAEFRF